jgi:hypothetical protein
MAIPCRLGYAKQARQSSTAKRANGIKPAETSQDDFRGERRGL